MRISLSVEKLQGKQSVRTTFRLPDYMIKLMSVVAFQLGIKQKSLFDHLLEDEKMVKEIAEKAVKHNVQLNLSQRRQKTYVLSRRSLEIIDKLSKDLNISRDFVVALSIQRLLPIINAEQKKHKSRSLIYKDMENYLEQGRKLFKKAENLLGAKDATCKMIKESNDINERNISDLRKKIEKSKMIQDFAKLKLQ